MCHYVEIVNKMAIRLKSMMLLVGMTLKKVIIRKEKIIVLK